MMSSPSYDQNRSAVQLVGLVLEANFNPVSIASVRREHSGPGKREIYKEFLAQFQSSTNPEY